MNLEDEEGFLENQVENQKRNIRDWDESKQTESLKIIEGDAVKGEENNLEDLVFLPEEIRPLYLVHLPSSYGR